MNDTNTNIFQTWCEFFMHQSQIINIYQLKFAEIIPEKNRAGLLTLNCNCKKQC